MREYSRRSPLAAPSSDDRGLFKCRCVIRELVDITRFGRIVCDERRFAAAMSCASIRVVGVSDRRRVAALVRQSSVCAPGSRTNGAFPPHKHGAPLDQPIFAAVRTTAFASCFAHERRIGAKRVRTGQTRCLTESFRASNRASNVRQRARRPAGIAHFLRNFWSRRRDSNT